MVSVQHNTLEMNNELKPFNARKTLCCLLIHKHRNNITASVSIGVVNIRKPEGLDVLAMKIQCDVRRNHKKAASWPLAGKTEVAHF